MFSVPSKAKRKRPQRLSDAAAVKKKRIVNPASSSPSTKPTPSSTPFNIDSSIPPIATTSAPPPTDKPDPPKPPKSRKSKKNAKNGEKTQKDQPPPSDKDKDKPTTPRTRPRITKLAPPRPFPTVAKSSSATGPYSARAEGKNNICVTRRSPLGMYLRRCVALINDDGYRTLDFYALGAAIPHLLLLTTSLPRILPFPEDEITSSIHTGTVKCVDEVFPEKEGDEDEGEENTLRERDKSCLRVTLKIGDGERVGGRKGAPIRIQKKRETNTEKGKGKGKGKSTDSNRSGLEMVQKAEDGIPDAPDDDEMVE